MSTTVYPIPLVRSPWSRWRLRTDAPTRLASPRRSFQIVLGLLWLLDAALQYQPYMFTKGFVNQIILPTTKGNPGWIAASETWAAGVMVHHIVVVDAAFATIQLLLAVAILWRPTVRIGLAASVAWALGVWWFGEGLGGVLTGASGPAGSPGAVILYGLVALLVWPRTDEPGVSVATSGALRRRWARLSWLVLWGGLTYFFVLPANRAPGVWHDLVAGMAGGEPGWLAGFDHSLAAALAGIGGEVSIALAVACALVALSAFVPALTRSGVVLAAALGLAFWAAQDFGGILTGQGTDPNSGLLLVLVALTFWPFAGAPGTVSAAGVPAAGDGALPGGG